MKKGIAIVVAVGLLVGLLWQVGVRLKESKAKEAAMSVRRGASAVAVEVAGVRKEEIRDVATFTGSLQSRSYFVVAPKVAGRLIRLTVGLGDEVKRGQLVAELEDEEYQRAVQEMKAQLGVQEALVQEAESALKIGKKEYDRAREMKEKNIASEAQFDAAQAAYFQKEAGLKVAQAWIEQKKAALSAAEVRLSYTKIAATWEGGEETRLVGEKFVDEGAMLRANDAIVSVVDISRLTAVVYIIERDYSKVAMGQEAVITTDAYPREEFTGKVARIAPVLKENVRQARVEIEIGNADGRLKPGMFVRAGLEFARHAGATVVPYAALVKREGMDGVFMVDGEGKKAKFVAVKVGIVDKQRVEIVEPALEGKVVTIGQHLLNDGTEIEVTEGEQTQTNGGGR